jgi:ribosomal-protein-serine acetyltransferase
MEYLPVGDDLHLDALKISHAAVVYQAIDKNRYYLRRWLPFVDQTRRKEDTEIYIRMLLSEREKSANEVFTLWYKGDFAGLAGFKDMDFVNHKTEIGYWLIESMQGRGIMTRTVKKLIDYGFRNLNFNRIQIKVALGNHKSAAIPVRLGMVSEGIERAGEYHTDGFFDLEIFSILKADWIASLLNN